jgi:hypothetical protein
MCNGRFIGINIRYNREQTLPLATLLIQNFSNRAIIPRYWLAIEVTYSKLPKRENEVLKQVLKKLKIFRNLDAIILCF